MRKLLLILLFGLLITGCTTGNARTDVDARASLLAALNSQADGYQGVIAETGEGFTIQSTSASSTRLCRVVSIESGDRYLVESFCKAKGGAWR